MAKDSFDDQIDGQMDLEEILNPPERLVAVSRVFARARKEMTLAEQKTFVFALSHLRFKEDADSPVVHMDKKALAEILGIHSDADHLSVDLYDEIKHLPSHSYIRIADKDLDFYDSGLFITRVTMLKNRVRIKFEEEYLKLFTGLSGNYITLWSLDIFRMTSKRSVVFYEYLRQVTDTRENVNSVGLGIKALKEMFDIPKEGKGSYMRDRGGFNRSEFEKKVIEPICADLMQCNMIQLVMQPDGKPYEKVKQGNRVNGYRFYWTFSARPSVASAEEVKEIQEHVDQNPEVLKVAKDLIAGEKKKKTGEKLDKRIHNFNEREYDFAELEKKLIQN